ncbi:MAG TPA: alpha-amylase family glycosyl hydrolase [Rubricoccaceae bacterium]|nr:alpha-amylase family glycosyl hydrolase [Rubricoccaceae bacterium]
MRLRFPLLAVLSLPVFAFGAQAQDSLNVTFRYLPDLTLPNSGTVVRAFVPGEFNGWGTPYTPGTPSCIGNAHPSVMTYYAPLAEYRKTIRLRVGGGTVPGGGYAYKIQVHRNSGGTECDWLTDPLGTETTGQNNDSVVRVTNPMAFQLAREETAPGQIGFVSAGLFGTAAFTAITFQVNNVVYNDGLSYYDAATGIFRFQLPATAPRGSLFRITATDALGRTVTKEVGLIPPVVTDAPVPAGLGDGINYHPSDPTRATLVLRAPNKNYVYVLGSFNGWQPNGAYLMRRDNAATGGTRWWVELTGLSPGTEYPFQYLVDGYLRVGDPYAQKVLFSGQSGYPSQAQGYAATVLQPGRSPYPWVIEDFDGPPQRDLVVYELLIRDFLAAHSYTALIDTLDYLQRLGVNAIELMPVAEFDGDLSWGYNPAFYFAPDRYYGSADQLKAFVDACHQRGIAVLLDVVYNHQTGQSPFVRLYAQGDYGPPAPDNPWVNVTARHPFNVYYDNNHESVLTQYWLDRANEYWLTEFKVDGFRFDLSKGFVQTCGGGTCTDANWSLYNQGRINLLTRMADVIWSVDPEAYVILEHFAEQSEELALTNHGRSQGFPGMMLWKNMNTAYAESSMGYLNAQSDLRGAYPPNNGYPLDAQVAYMESHDEQWLMFKNRNYGACTNFPGGGAGCNTNPGPYNIRDLYTALGRQQLAAAFFLTMPGPKMLWEFSELGYGGGPGECLVNGDYPGECPNGTPGRVDPKPIRWDYWVNVPPVPPSNPQTSPAERARRREVYETFMGLLFLRNTYDVFRAPTTIQMQVGQNQPDRWIKLERSGLTVVVVGNFGLTQRTQNPPLTPGTWHDYFSRETMNVTQANPPITLEPGQFRVFTNQPLTPPPTAGEEGPDEAPAAFHLGAAYPNPFNPQATIPYEVPEAGPVRLEVFDALGRRVAVLADGWQAAGPHTARFNGAGLPSGVYVVRLTAGDQVASQRLTLLK